MRATLIPTGYFVAICLSAFRCAIAKCRPRLFESTPPLEC
jgi:hypothetical protein